LQLCRCSTYGCDECARAGGKQQPCLCHDAALQPSGRSAGSPAAHV
jgi:hypothetical protein